MVIHDSVLETRGIRYSRFVDAHHPTIEQSQPTQLLRPLVHGVADKDAALITPAEH